MGLVLVLIASVACLVPARRAATVDPLVALRPTDLRPHRARAGGCKRSHRPPGPGTIFPPSPSLPASPTARGGAGRILDRRPVAQDRSDDRPSVVSVRRWKLVGGRFGRGSSGLRRAAGGVPPMTIWVAAADPGGAHCAGPARGLGTPVLEPFPVLLLTVVISVPRRAPDALLSVVLAVVYGIHFSAEPAGPCATSRWGDEPARRRPHRAGVAVWSPPTAPPAAGPRCRALPRRGRGPGPPGLPALAGEHHAGLVAGLRGDAARAGARPGADPGRLVTIPRSTSGTPRASSMGPYRDSAAISWCASSAKVRRRAAFLRRPSDRQIDRGHRRAAPGSGPRRRASQAVPGRSTLLGSADSAGAQDRLAGVLTLGMSREYARAFGEQDVRHALELGERVSFAVGAGHVFHQAREPERRLRLLFEVNPQPMWIFDAGDPGVPRGQRSGGPPLRVLARRIPRHDYHGRPTGGGTARIAVRPPDPAVPTPPSPGTSGRTVP